jgi:hypothetical protein
MHQNVLNLSDILITSFALSGLAVTASIGLYGRITAILPAPRAPINIFFVQTEEQIHIKENVLI